MNTIFGGKNLAATAIAARAAAIEVMPLPSSDQLSPPKSLTALARIFIAMAMAVMPIPAAASPREFLARTLDETAIAARSDPTPVSPLASSSQFIVERPFTDKLSAPTANARRIRPAAITGSLRNPAPRASLSSRANAPIRRPNVMAKPATALRILSGSMVERTSTEAASNAIAIAISLRVLALRLACIAPRVPLRDSNAPVTPPRRPSPRPDRPPPLPPRNLRIPRTRAANRPVFNAARALSQLMLLIAPAMNSPSPLKKLTIAAFVLSKTPADPPKLDRKSCHASPALVNARPRGPRAAVTPVMALDELPDVLNPRSSAMALESR